MLALPLLCLTAHAGALLTGPVEDPAALAAGWQREAGWRHSEVRFAPEGGTRVGALATAPLDVALRLEARGVGADGSTGPWVPVGETWRDDVSRVLVADLGERWPGAEVRGRGVLDLDTLTWELLIPAHEPQAEGPPPPPSALSAGLQDLGVVSRETWGARSTRCSSLEDDWYRFAIHHTAGSQTSGGTVEGAVRALQAYSMDSGSYCDIPYQFLVGHDGSLWEGRPLTYLSGATGGGNNPGNIAVSYLGCYTPSGCPGSSHADTDAMMAWGRLLVQTLADEHGITTDTEWLRGHRDWPGNSTVCPGEYVYARLAELRDDRARFQAEVDAAAFPIGGSVEVPIGEPVTLWVDLYNGGSDAWSPASTRLAPLPRDVASPVQGDGWISGTRIAAVPESVSPGASTRVSFTVVVPDAGPHDLSLALVEEARTWFADRPYGGGFSEGSLTVTLVGVEGGGAGTSGSGGGGGGDSGDTARPGGGDGGLDYEDPPGFVPQFAATPPPAEGGCACDISGRGTPALLLLPLALLPLRRRP
jgi:N-acetylmuramoyl-L-alanine amidase